jgi:hypothetical protein
LPHPPQTHQHILQSFKQLWVMADPLCGPSNALQNFQKHSTVDRTLQQDRLVSRQSPSQVCPSVGLGYYLDAFSHHITHFSNAIQGFRSAGLNAGALDPEFESFQRGNLPLESHQSFQQPVHQAGPSSWASDFQRMNLSGSQIPQEPQSQHTHQQRTGGWHQDFAQFQRGEQRAVNTTPSQMTQNGGYQYAGLGMGVGMGMQPQLGAQFSGIAGQALQSTQPVEAFDEAAFARAFDEAAKTELDTTQIQNTEQEILLSESAERFMETQQIPAEDQIPDQPKIGADIIYDPLDKNFDAAKEDDPDELAKTAGHLLSRTYNLLMFPKPNEHC